MTEMSFEQMEQIQGGNMFVKTCAIIATGSAVYALGVITNWWNPIGWVSAGFVAGDLVCAAYAVASS